MLNISKDSLLRRVHIDKDTGVANIMQEMKLQFGSPSCNELTVLMGVNKRVPISIADGRSVVQVVLLGGIQVVANRGFRDDLSTVGANASISKRLE